MSTKNITFTTFMFGTSIGMEPERIGDLIRKLGEFYEKFALSAGVKENKPDYTKQDKVAYMHAFRLFVQEGDFDYMDLILIGGYLGLLHGEVLE